MKCVSKWIAITSGIFCIFLQPSARAIINQGSSNSVLVANNTTAPENQSQFDYKDFDFWANQCVTLENARQYNEALSACEKLLLLNPRAKILIYGLFAVNSTFKFGEIY
ncbi:MAG: hypothetical protein HC908_08580 [Calothrix sp. SM1_7_51]|nr:hypothetical protein [Calothrix sp. SM1_7_51]